MDVNQTILDPDFGSPCPRCGGERTPGTHGLCPKCLAKAAFFPEDSLAYPGGKLPGGTPVIIRYFGDYVLESEIARGGMGIVYRARQVSLDREVAVKVMRDGAFASDDEIGRFRKEATAAAALRHPHIVGIHEIGEYNGQHFFSMDLVEGETLAQMTKAGPLPARRAAEWMVQIAQAIEHAHENAVLHRDLKPSNVLIDDAGQAMVMDFGLARREGPDHTLTMTGLVMGTPGYMAPEQTSGRPELAGPHTDVYGLGALLYDLLTGRPPFTGESSATIFRQVEESEPVPPRLLNPSVPRDLETVCLKALAKEVPRRYDTAGDMAEDLGRFLRGEPVKARPVSAAYRAWRWARRKPALAGSLAAVFALATGVALVSTLAARRLEVSRAAEQTARQQAQAGERQARLNLYAADMKVAQDLWEKGSMQALGYMLDQHVPAAGGPDFRGFDWYVLKNRIQGEQRETVKIPGGPVFDAALTADGTRAVIVRVDTNTVNLIDTADGRDLLSWTENASVISGYRQLIRQPGSQRLLSVSLHGVRLLDPDAGTVEVLDESPWGAAAFSADGSQVALSGGKPLNGQASDRLEVWDVATKKPVWEAKAQARGLTWSADGKELCLLTLPAELQWFTPGGSPEPVRRVKFADAPDGGAYQGWFSPDGELVIILWNGRGLGVHRTATGERLTDLAGASNFGVQVAISPDSQRVAVSGFEQAVRVMALPDGRPLQFFRGHSDRVAAVGFGEGGEVLSLSLDQTLRRWGTGQDAGVLTKELDYAAWDMGKPVISSDGRYVALPSKTGLFWTPSQSTGLIYDLREGREVADFDDLPLAFSPDGSQLLCLHDWDHYRLRGVPAGEESGSFSLDRHPHDLAPRVSPDGRYIALWHKRGDGHVYEVATSRPVLELAEWTGEAQFSPDSRRLAVAHERLLQVHDLETGSRLKTALASPTQIAWSADGKLLIAAAAEFVRLADAATGEVTGTLTGHRGAVTAVAISPDGGTLATGGQDNMVRLWNRATLRETLSLAAPSAVTTLAFTPDGQRLVHGGHYGFRVVEAPRPGVPDLRLPAPAPLPAGSLWLGAEVIQKSQEAIVTEESADCGERMLALWKEAEAYRAEHGRWPDYLSEAHVPVAKDGIWVCPSDVRAGVVRQWAGWNDPGVATSFIYQFTANENRDEIPAVLDWHPAGKVSNRELADRLHARYGDAMPFLRCLGHNPNNGVLTVTCGGKLCRMPLDFIPALEAEKPADH